MESDSTFRYTGRMSRSKQSKPNNSAGTSRRGRRKLVKPPRDQLTLRIPIELHARLDALAAKRNRYLNDEANDALWAWVRQQEPLLGIIPPTPDTPTVPPLPSSSDSSDSGSSPQST